MKKKLHLVSFDVPYPANYGGIIDVFYKIKTLHLLDVEIYLHVFDYGKGKQAELENYCKQIYYYPRNSYLKSFFDPEIPFIVKSRGNDDLIKNLKSKKIPILFDGLHTTYVLSLTTFVGHKIYVRAHNVEHSFYDGLFKSETNGFKKMFYKEERKKLKKYEEILKKVDGIFSISPYEQEYFLRNYGKKSHYIPAFHDVSEKKQSLSKKGKIILFHGNLKVAENMAAAIFLINIFKETSFNFVIASSFENKTVLKSISATNNITFKKLTSDEDLHVLFKQAHINVLTSFQKTGIKLKLINALRQSRFVIANDFIMDDTGLETIIEKANSKKEFLQKTSMLFNRDFSEAVMKERAEKLTDIHPLKSAKKMAEIIFML
jgi:hypothetical protein